MRFELQAAVLSITIAILLLLQPIQIGHAEMSSRLTIKPEANAFVGSSSSACLGYGCNQLDNQNMERGMNVTELRVGLNPYGERLFSPMISYIRFDLGSIPRSDIWSDISVDSAVLSLLANKEIGSQSRYLVTVASCKENSWFEHTVTYLSRPCPNNRGATPLDSIIIGNSFPAFYSWTVTEGVSNAINSTRQDTFTAIAQWFFRILHPTNNIPSQITFKVTGNTTEPTAHGFVIFAARQKEGAYVGPPVRLIVSYRTDPSNFNTTAVSTVTIALPILVAIWGGAHYLYRKKRTNDWWRSIKYKKYKRKSA